MTTNFSVCIIMDEEKPTETLLDKRAIRQRKQREYYAPTGGPGGAARVRSNSRRRALTARSSRSRVAAAPVIVDTSTSSTFASLQPTFTSPRSGDSAARPVTVGGVAVSSKSRPAFPAGAVTVVERVRYLYRV